MKILNLSLLAILLFNVLSYAIAPDDVDPEEMKYIIQQERNRALEEYNAMVRQREIERIKSAEVIKQGGSQKTVRSLETGNIDRDLTGDERSAKRFSARPYFYFLVLFCAALYIIYSKTFKKRIWKKTKRA